MMGHTIEGIAELLAVVDCPIHVHKDETEWIAKSTSVTADHLEGHDSGDVVSVGSIDISLVHTPGHTPGSQCFLVEGALVSGDTLFVNGCGRVDLPGSDVDAMYDSLTNKLAKLPPETVLFPGHHYGPTATSTIEHELRHNFYMRMPTIEDWHRLMGVHGR
jgi:glyoxylase-like metal-dependent hydrolase (beta-lactamase superfamily II)